ncbi:helix-turn-helix transcriptional regulator [Leekyejoonella antrihumi]|uniref:Transcriptional regulator n=1 Tax=Leekyejoonella antrihumi TaxID=1660198 RepID=A0A563E4E8_9MICO|nr:metalloregulator ArsR/SmtB family transcription factor [Leekyejoonella antrihumi]TWP37179.1 transcriptional regulator [Leekyejoonella antrihumi]
MIFQTGSENAEAGTRDRVLRTVSEDGPITAAELAEQLGLTAAAVRRHLDCLFDAHLLEEREHATPGGRKRGRPARAYVLSEAGHATLRGDYDALASSVLRFLRDSAGPDAVAAFAEQQAGRLGRRVQSAMVTDGPLADRTAALAVALTQQGYAASTRPVGDNMPMAGVQLCQGHCPVQHVAMEFPQFCEAEAQMFSRTLGVHVQRLSSLAHGDHVCTTFIPTPALPIDPPADLPTSERDPR